MPQIAQLELYPAIVWLAGMPPESQAADTGVLPASGGPAAGGAGNSRPGLQAGKEGQLAASLSCAVPAGC